MKWGALPRRANFLYVVAALSLIGLSVFRLLPAYNTYCGTVDEPYHIAAGMEWLDKGTYTYELQHPPLARIAVALGPFLAGLRAHSLQPPTVEGNAILRSNGQYRRNLLLARLGNLPFLLLASVTIVLWTRRWFTKADGLWALGLFLSLPPVLGQAALALLDIGCAATLAFSLYQLLRWIEDPSWRRSTALGAALSLAFLTKFSNFAFALACCAAAILYWIVTRPVKSGLYREVRARFAPACLAGLVLLLLPWACYRFSLLPVSRNVEAHTAMDKSTRGSAALGKIAYTAVTTPLPLTEVVKGIHEVYQHNEGGHSSYLLGAFSRTGWWYFFPVVLAVKTPIGFLLLSGAGLFSIGWRFRKCPWQRCLTALFPCAILLVGMTSRIDLGVRHILPIYVWLAILAGHFIGSAFRRRKRSAIVMVVALAGSVAVDSWLAHPDYLAYFNQFAGGHPERILAESDLDMGQDWFRLGERLRALGVREVSVMHYGTAPLEEAGLPPYRELAGDERATGYVAVSVRRVTLDNARNGAYEWLKRCTPLERIGGSIFLYRIEQ